jgi:diguanylate cyclase (GGDEF)-like protein
LKSNHLGRIQIIAGLCIALLALCIGFLLIGKKQQVKANQSALSESVLVFEEQLFKFIATATQLGYQYKFASTTYNEFTEAVTHFPNLDIIENIWLVNFDGTYMDVNAGNPQQDYLATQDDTDHASIPLNISDSQIWASYFFGANSQAYDVFLSPNSNTSLSLTIPFIEGESERVLIVNLNIKKWGFLVNPNQQISLNLNNQLIWSSTEEGFTSIYNKPLLGKAEFVLYSLVPFDLWLYLLPAPLLVLFALTIFTLQKTRLEPADTEAAIHHAAEQLDLLLMETDVQGQVLWLTSGADHCLRIFNIHKGEFIRDHLANHPRIISYMYASLNGEKLTYEIEDSGYSFRIKQQPRYDKYQEIIGLSILIEDITEQVELEKRLKHQQMHDKLTNLPNRQLFEQQLTHDIHRAKRHQSSVAILAIEINGLGNINKTLGHHMGDLALKLVAKQLKVDVRSEDMISRFSSDEFLVICDDYRDPTELRTVAQRLIDKTTAGFTINDQRLTLSANIGIATYPRDSKDSGSLISNAIAAMRHARQSGRNTLDYFSTDNAKLVQRKWQLEQSLASAAKANTFELHYQPIFDVKTNCCKGAEALIRWPDGKLTPDQFIPMAEQSGLMHGIGCWVLENALSQLQKWKKITDAFQYMSVNVSVEQLKEPNFINSVKAIVAEHPFSKGSVILELTESVMMTSSEQMVNKIRQLKAMGFRIAIDDFGLGYSSLSYLKFLPIDILKIDKSFIDGIPNDESNVLICEAIVQMSRAMNLKIVAEGVETPEQMAWLTQKGVETAQGFFYARAVPASQFETFLPINEN